MFGWGLCRRRRRRSCMATAKEGGGGGGLMIEERKREGEGKDVPGLPTSHHTPLVLSKKFNAMNPKKKCWT